MFAVFWQRAPLNGSNTGASVSVKRLECFRVSVGVKPPTQRGRSSNLWQEAFLGDGMSCMNSEMDRHEQEFGLPTGGRQILAI